MTVLTTQIDNTSYYNILLVYSYHINYFTLYYILFYSTYSILFHYIVLTGPIQFAAGRAADIQQLARPARREAAVALGRDAVKETLAGGPWKGTYLRQLRSLRAALESSFVQPLVVGASVGLHHYSGDQHHLKVASWSYHFVNTEKDKQGEKQKQNGHGTDLDN